MVDTKTPEKQKRHRSPAYPGINLQAALERARSIYAVERRNAANVSVVAKHWKLSPKSSGALIAFAALSAFGLVESSGNGDQRTLKLSELALRILLDERAESTDRDSAIKRAALRPKIHQQLWEKWGSNLPSDENFKHALVFDWKFNENAVSEFITQYKSTISFAGLSDSDVVSAAEDDSEEMNTQTAERQDQERGGFGTNKRNDNSALHDSNANKFKELQANSYSWPLSKDINAQVLITGNGLKASHIEMLKRYLDIVKSALEIDGDQK